MKILLASPIDPEAVESLRREHDVVLRGDGEEELRAQIADREVLVFRSGVTISADLLESAAQLRLIVRAGSGLDNVDLGHVRQRGIRLARVAGPSAQAVAEFTFALMFGLARKVILADKLIREGRWPKPSLGGPLLTGKTLGIVGVGNIGTRVGELAVAWGMDAIGCVEHYSPERAAELAEKGVTLTDLDTVLARGTFVTLHVPLNESTHHMIDEQALSKMSEGSFLINAARGGVVDDKALYRDLAERGHLGGAALDVHEEEGEGTISPLATLPNVILTPHIGGMALDSQREIGRRVIEIIESFEQGKLDAAARDGELVV